MEKGRNNSITIRTIRLRPSLLVLLVILCVITLAALVIPQRIRIREAKDELAARQQELTDIKLTYEQERRNLEYMRTDEYKVQQGLQKYGWHYKQDTLIEDDTTVPEKP
ncbi:MAG: hypothetical protein IJP98_06005 [Clostridia bacterium]|nr:hypothetical protein [Clostridia bacterium]